MPDALRQNRPVGWIGLQSGVKIGTSESPDLR
jgi:hypothetical protein